MNFESNSAISAELEMSNLHAALEDPALTSMTFLNEVAERYPDTVSFAAGRPFEGNFDVEEVHSQLRSYCDYLSRSRGFSKEDIRRTLYQYGNTKGVVNELVARNLEIDEGIHADPEAIIVTVGCQEAMVLVLRALKADANDVLFAIGPTYVGLTGAAKLVDMRVLSVPGGPRGVDIEVLTDQVTAARKAGLRPRGCYVMPDFANPSGVSMDLETRRGLLDFAEQTGLFLLEDNPYGLFHGDDDKLPTLKSLDSHRHVIYLGSYAKSVLPGARIGYIIADQRVRHQNGKVGLLSDQLAKIKSMLTVNTSPIAQAVVAGKLVESDCNLEKANSVARHRYSRQMGHLLSGLAARFDSPSRFPGVEWNKPSGGFFAVLTVPFPANDGLLRYSAEKHRVLWTPMHHFYGGTAGYNQIRLCISVVDGPQIESGLDRLYALVEDRITGA